MSEREAASFRRFAYSFPPLHMACACVCACVSDISDNNNNNKATCARKAKNKMKRSGEAKEKRNNNKSLTSKHVSQVIEHTKKNITHTQPQKQNKLT